MNMDEKTQEEIWNMVAEINDLATLRRTLALGTNTGDRNSAESTLSRKISTRVNELSRKILAEYKES